MSNTDLNIYARIGLGDLVSATAMFKAYKMSYPEARINVICETRAHREIVLNNPHVDEIFTIDSLRSTRFLNKKINDLNYGLLLPTLLVKKKSYEIFCDMVGVERNGCLPEIFLTDEEDEAGRKEILGMDNPIIFNPYTAFSKNREWGLQNWETLISRHPDVQFLQIGKGNEMLVNGAIDKRGLSIRASVAMMKAAKRFIGSDSLWCDVSLAVQVKSVILFGPSSPIVWGYDHNINISMNLQCAPCLDLLFEQKCPFGVRCMKAITVEMVSDHLDKLLRGDSK